MTDYDIFREQLGIRYPGYGHALWDPSPSNPDRPVEVGDVGFIRRGRFYRLFNALLPAHDKLQDHGVPEYYEQLKPNMKTHVSKSSLTCNDYCSTGVCAIGESEYLSSPDIRRVSFTCSERRRGAVLSLPVKAQRMDTLVQSDFSEWIVKHIDCCFAFARRLGLGIERMEEIILVTGCDRARSWTNVAFLGGPVGAQASFGIKVTGDFDTSVSIQFQRGHDQGALLNQGPEGKNLPENQCVFIRGFRVTRVFNLFPKRLKAAAGPSQGPDGYDCEPDKEVISIPAVTTYRDPLHVLLDYISEAHDCDMVLVHDDDLERIDEIGKGTSLGSLQPEVVLDLLRRSNMTIYKVCCNLSSVGSSPHAGTGVVWVAMLSMLYHNWNILLSSQSLPNVVQNLGPRAYHAGESPSPSPPTPPDNPPSPPIQDDKSKHKRSLLKHHDDDADPVCQDLRHSSPVERLGRATEYFVILTSQETQSLSVLSVILLALGNTRRSFSNVWSNLCKFAREERLKLVSAFTVTCCIIWFLGWIFSFTWCTISKLFCTLLLASLTLVLLFELGEIYGGFGFLRHRVMSRAGVPGGLRTEARNIFPVMAKTIPPDWKTWRQRAQAWSSRSDKPLVETTDLPRFKAPALQEDSGDTRTIISLGDHTTEQCTTQPWPDMESAFSHWPLDLLAMKKQIEQLSANSSLLHQPEVLQNMSPNFLALRRSSMRLLMCCSSLNVTDFTSPEGYFGPPATTPYYPTGDIQGDRNAAFTSAMESFDALEVLLVVNDRAKIVAKQSELAQALSDLGLHDYANTTSGFTLDLVRKLYAATPDDFRLRVASIQSLRANILFDLGKTEQAIRAADEAKTLYEEHGRLQGIFIPESAYTWLDYAVLLCSIGRNKEGAKMASELLNKADELWEDKEYIFALCKLCLSNAWAEINSDSALSAAEEAIDYCQTQLDINLRAVSAGALLTKSKILSRNGGDNSAHTFSAKAVILLRRINDERPVFSLILAHALDTYSEQLLEANRKEESYLIAQEAVSVWKALRTSAPDPITRSLAWALFHLATFRRGEGDKDTLRNELQVSESAVHTFRDVSPLDAAGLAHALYLFADRLLELDEKHEAAVNAEEAVKYFREAVSQAPHKYTLDLILSLSLASSCLASVARVDDALGYAKQAIEVQRERVGAVEYDKQLRKLLTDVVLRFSEAGRLGEALPWFRELQALGETRDIVELTGLSNDVTPKSSDGSTSTETQHKLATLENIGPFLSILNTGHNDLMSSLIEVGDPGLAQPSADESGSGGLPDGSRKGGMDGLGGMGKFGSLAASLRASWREERRNPESFSLDSDLGGKETVDSGEDDELWHHPPSRR